MSAYSFFRKFLKDEEYEQLIKDKEAYKHDFENVTKLYHELMNNPVSLTQEAIMKSYWDNKHVKKEVYYLGRYLPVRDDLIQCDVKDFITPNDSMIQALIKDNGLIVQDHLNCNSDIVKIYQFCRRNSVYKGDYAQFNKDEVWLFPFEFIYLNSVGDCDDNSHYIASMLICAGVPSFRVRVVCGLCNLGGHSTVYVLGDDLNTWYHINSTGGYEQVNDLTLYPTSKETSTDGLGIKNVWFSFNNEFSWSSFDTGEAAKSFDELAKFIKIV